MSSKAKASSAASDQTPVVSDEHSDMRSPLKPLLWMALLLAALIAFGVYSN